MCASDTHRSQLSRTKRSMSLKTLSGLSERSDEDRM